MVVLIAENAFPFMLFRIYRNSTFIHWLFGQVSNRLTHEIDYNFSKIREE